MSTLRRVAIMIDLDWPVVRHHHVVSGIHRYARECGRWEYSINPHADLLLADARKSGDLDGIVARATTRLAERAAATGVPVVNVWLSTPAPHLPSVVHDTEAAGRMAARHLIARGFRSFAFLGVKGDRGPKLQCAGFRAELAEAKLPCSECWVSMPYAHTARNWLRFQAELNRWIDNWTPPVGVHVAYDLFARYVAEACKLRGLKVPEQVALVGTFNETLVCNNPEPSLTSIEFRFERIGYRAAQLLDELMDGAAPPSEPIRMAPVELVARHSSDAFAVDDPTVERALRYIAENAHAPIDVERIAEHAATTRRTLARLFRKSLGRTVFQVITHMRLERAKRMLADSDALLAFIADRCGFTDAVHLCKVFRREEGVTPTEYRNARQ